MLTGPLDKVMKPYTKKDFWVNSYIMALEKKLPKQERRKTNLPLCTERKVVLI